jgi:hypothetical protein
MPDIRATDERRAPDRMAHNTSNAPKNGKAPRLPHPQQPTFEQLATSLCSLDGLDPLPYCTGLPQCTLTGCIDNGVSQSRLSRLHQNSASEASDSPPTSSPLKKVAISFSAFSSPFFLPQPTGHSSCTQLTTPDSSLKQSPLLMRRLPTFIPHARRKLFRLVRHKLLIDHFATLQPTRVPSH